MRGRIVLQTIMPKPLNEKVDETVCDWIGNPKGFCEYIFHTVIVTTSGQMSLCCIDYNSLNAFGDMTQHSFVDTYFSKEHMDILQKMADGKRAAVPGCANCRVVKNSWSTDSAKRTSRLPFGYSWKRHVQEQWQQWREQGICTVAIYGAGIHTHALETALTGCEGPDVIAVLDDHPKNGPRLFGQRPQRAAAFPARKVDAVVLSSDVWQQKMENRCRCMYGNQVRLLDLYEGLPGGPYDKDFQ